MENRKGKNTKPSAGRVLPKKNVNKHNPPLIAKKKAEPVKKIQNNDTISKLVKANLYHILKQIFSSLSPGDLTACRLVSHTWHDYFAHVFWADKVIRKGLEHRLDKNWQNEKHRRVEVIVEGAACRENCSLNYRSCDCPLLCQVAQNALVILFGAKDFTGTYRINDNPSTHFEHDFERPQYQVRLSLKLNLLLDTSNFLWKPVFHKKQVKKTKVLHGDTVLEVDDKDKTFLLIKNKTSKEITRRVQPYTGI